mmetsp:Transcript_38379/g.114955  ORF Transcript_38379/g.114955 Transcript_38379/m.114955 type:complete len:222 (+) Transcript_38379:1999-2664(+)
MLPDATGSISNEEKISPSDPGGMQRDCSTVFSVKGHEWAGASEWSWERASHRASGNMSARVEAHWPHLMNAGPLIARLLPIMPNQIFFRNGGSIAASHAVHAAGAKVIPSRHARTVSAANDGGSSEFTNCSSLSRSSAKAAAVAAHAAGGRVSSREDRSSGNNPWPFAAMTAGSGGESPSSSSRAAIRPSSFFFFFFFFSSSSSSSPSPSTPSAPFRPWPL